MGAFWTLTILLVFVLHAGWHVPDVNESHYLTKARHYWDPSWVPHDFFLNSKDSHEVFYLSLGWLTKGLSLEAFAWTGRVLTWSLLAVAFYRLCDALRVGGGYAPLAAALLLALNSRVGLAGEWIVGGFEAKGLAYVAVLCGLERWIRGRWNQALIAVGVATAWHVLVGGWSAIALGFAWLTLGNGRPPLRSLWPGLLVSALLALPALLLALGLNGGESAAIIDRANRIYVFGRLPHHLLPSHFGGQALLQTGLLWIVWWLLGRRLPADDAIRRFRGFVNGAMAIALVGFVLFFVTRGNGELAARVLRYYWFRLADVAVPLGVAILAIRWMQQLASFRRAQRLLLAALVLVAGASLWGDAQRHVRAGQPVPDSPKRVADYAAWRDVCRWVSSNTPPEAIFLTPRLAQTFKWYAERAEVVNLKDVPQDAESIVDWWQRLASVHRVLLPNGERQWLDSLAQRSPERLQELAARYGADYLITQREPKLPFETIYSNQTYAVYRLPHHD